jgi:hypothetical protein
MSYYLTEAEVETINQNHNHYTDVYKRGNSAITGAVIYSRITEVIDDTFYLEVYINDNWNKTPKETTKIFTNYWLNNKYELKKCKYYKTTLFTVASLGFASLTLTNFQEFVNSVASEIKLQDYQKTDYSLSNTINSLERLKRLLNSSKHYPINTTVYKIYLDLDLQFYDIDLKPFLRIYAYDEDEFYTNDISLPTVMKIELANDNGYIEFPKLKYSKLPNNSHYAVITFKRTNKVFSTNMVSNVQSVELDSIEIYKFVRFKGVKLISKADKTRLQTINN